MLRMFLLSMLLVLGGVGLPPGQVSGRMESDVNPQQVRRKGGSNVAAADPLGGRLGNDASADDVEDQVGRRRGPTRTRGVGLKTGAKAESFTDWPTAVTLQAGGQPTVQPAGDLGFNASVARPAYLKSHPKVLFDAAHNNADTSGGRYRPFADLITADGYAVRPNNERFSKSALKDYQVLIVVNASGPPGQRDASPFSDQECDAVRDWVNSGGGLLLISDQAPFSTAIAALSKRFDIDLTKGFTIDSVYHNKDSGDETELVFSRDNTLLGDHPITRGRDATERINRIITFTGTSLKGPAGSVPFLKLGDSAKDVIPSDLKPSAPGEAAPDPKQVSAAGRAQAVALAYGNGRVVVLGEAAMLTAQVALRGFRFGMNVSDIDNRQLALNIMHWLSGLVK